MERKDIHVFLFTDKKEILPFSSPISESILKNRTQILKALEKEENTIQIEEKTYDIYVKSPDSYSSLSQFFHTEVSLLLFQERNLSQARLETILNNLPGKILLINKNYEIQLMNTQFQEWRNRDETHQYCFETKGETEACETCILPEIFQTKKIIIQRNKQMFDNRSYDIYFIPLLDKNGEVQEVIKYYFDITEIKKTEETLYQLTEKLTEELMINGIYLDLARSILEADSFQEISQKVLKASQKLTKSPFGFVGYFQENGEFHIPTLTKEMFPGFPIPKEGVSFPEVKGLWGKSIQNQEGILTNDIHSHPLSTGVPEGHVELKKVLLVPAVIEGKTIGQIALANKTEDYTLSDKKNIEGLLPFFKLALKMEKQKKILQESQKKSESANAAKTMFLAQMSHELRTPLSIIIGLLDIIEKEEPSLSETVKEQLLEIKKAGIHQLELINNLLDLTKIEEKKYEYTFSRFNVSEEITNIFQLFRLKAQEKNLYYTLSLDPNITDFVYDLKNLKQILINLLSNALKYTDSGSVSLSVYKEKKNLVFHIKDSGKGMTEEDKKHIWQAFKRGSSSSKETMSTGLGLAIVKNLIDDLNGEISFTSEKNKGTEFRVTLKPQLEQNQEISETEKKKTHPFENIPVKGIHILLAEDENIIRIITTKLLKKQGALITATENGEELLEIFQKKSSEFDIIITDIEMPKKNGKEVIQEVRKISNIPLITLSAHAFKELEEEFKVLGANSTLTKPLHAEILQREIRILYWTKKFEEEHIFHTLFEKYISLSEEERKKFYNLSNYVKKNIIKDLYQLSERLEKFLENKEEPQSCEDIFTLISSLQEICLQEQVQNLFDLLKDIEQNINSTGEINLLLYLLQNSLKNLDENSSL